MEMAAATHKQSVLKQPPEMHALGGQIQEPSTTEQREYFNFQHRWVG
jgi:hypothetical protein